MTVAESCVARCGCSPTSRSPCRPRRPTAAGWRSPPIPARPGPRRVCWRAGDHRGRRTAGSRHDGAAARLPSGPGPAVAPLDQFLDGVRSSLAAAAPAPTAPLLARRRLVSAAATLRGIVADSLLGDPGLPGHRRRGLPRLDPTPRRGPGGGRLDPGERAVRPGVRPRGRRPPGDVVRAGLGVFLSGKMFFDYKGAIFWKMTAGMGDIVFAPLYQALRRRGVEFEFFHRVDGLHLSGDRSAVEADLGRSPGTAGRRAGGLRAAGPGARPALLPGPAAHRAARRPAGISDHDLESHWCSWPDADRVVLRRGVDFDVAVLAIPLGMAPVVCRELIDRPARWREMVTHVRTVATQSLQLWLREAEPDLGWPHPGATVSGYVKPFDTWSSMPQVIDAEDWPDDDRPRTVAYFCSTLAAPWPPGRPGPPTPGATMPACETHAPVRRAGTGAPAARHRRRAGLPLGPALRRAPGAGRARSTPSSGGPTSTRPTATSSRAGHGPVPAPAGRERLRQPVPRRRLDRLRSQRRLHRGRGPLRPRGRQRGARPIAVPPHRRPLPALTPHPLGRWTRAGMYHRACSPHLLREDSNAKGGCHVQDRFGWTCRPGAAPTQEELRDLSRRALPGAEPHPRACAHPGRGSRRPAAGTAGRAGDDRQASGPVRGQAPPVAPAATGPRAQADAGSARPARSGEWQGSSPCASRCCWASRGPPRSPTTCS